jgi:hypothetical protein
LNEQGVEEHKNLSVVPVLRSFQGNREVITCTHRTKRTVDEMVQDIALSPEDNCNEASVINVQYQPLLRGMQLIPMVLFWWLTMQAWKEDRIRLKRLFGQVKSSKRK